MQDNPAKTPAAKIAERDSFYRAVVQSLNASAIPYLVGGGHAQEIYSGMARPTKDLDLFARRADVELILNMFAQAPYKSEMSFPHWLGKIIKESDFIDVIFSSGNGVCGVDDGWFEHSTCGRFLDVHVKYCPPEEMIWAKSFVMERERYDGADVAHLIRACATRLDWRRLLARFGPHWRVLLSHLILFDYIYPSERSLIPQWIMGELVERLRMDKSETMVESRVCRGTFLSRVQYRGDVETWGYEDARQTSSGPMTAADAASWTAAAER